MLIILSETVDILLHALHGVEKGSNPIRIVNTVATIGKSILMAVGFLSKALEATVVLFALGQLISAPTNFLSILTSGYSTWMSLTSK